MHVKQLCTLSRATKCSQQRPSRRRHPAGCIFTFAGERRRRNGPGTARQDYTACSGVVRCSDKAVSANDRSADGRSSQSDGGGAGGSRAGNYVWRSPGDHKAVGLGTPRAVHLAELRITVYEIPYLECLPGATHPVSALLALMRVTLLSHSYSESVQTAALRTYTAAESACLSYVRCACLLLDIDASAMALINTCLRRMRTKMQASE